MPGLSGRIEGDYTPRLLRAALARPALVVVVGLAVAACLLPLDRGAASLARKFQPGGEWAVGRDLLRTLEFLQQFGDVASSVLVGLTICLLDPPARRRMTDWIVAALASNAVAHLLKALIGRPRPRVILGPNVQPGFDSAWYIPGPWRTYPVWDGSAGRHADLHGWEVWRALSGDLASAPSSHTVAASALAVGLTSMYPRLWPLVWSLVAIVAFARVLLGAHYPSDVVLGAAVGTGLASIAMRGCWGQRLLAAIPASRRPSAPA
jgi:membrane-associated phospholipid phosphatase